MQKKGPKKGPCKIRLDKIGLRNWIAENWIVELNLKLDIVSNLQRNTVSNFIISKGLDLFDIHINAVIPDLLFRVSVYADERFSFVSYFAGSR